MTGRAESLRQLEREVGVMIRRIRRVIGDRARAVHDDLQPASYLMLSWLADEGPVRASSMVDHFGIDKGAVSRQLQHLVELGLIERTPDPADGRATLVAASEDAIRRLEDVAVAPPQVARRAARRLERGGARGFRQGTGALQPRAERLTRARAQPEIVIWATLSPLTSNAKSDGPLKPLPPTCALTTVAAPPVRTPGTGRAREGRPCGQPRQG